MKQSLNSRSVKIPAQPKIYHIVHLDRLASIIADGCLWCDAVIADRQPAGTSIGMHAIKKRQCVPFYFCPRSIMLYLLHRGNHPDISYRGGQGSIVHLQADLYATVKWAEENSLRWAFTLSNAGAYYFEDRADIGKLNEIDWDAIHARVWIKQKESKQAEFLVERHFPWQLVERIGVYSETVRSQVTAILGNASKSSLVTIEKEWYY